MTDSQYNEMVLMLTKATKSRKLSWTWDEQSGEYSTKLGDCSVVISSSIDFQMQSESVSLMLKNANGDQFDSYNRNSVIDPEGYSDLEALYAEVRDSYFKIRESESTILSKLRELTTEPQTIPSSSSDDDLPF